MGGYIMRQTKWLGTGSAGYDEDKITRAQEILQRFADLLLSTNTGWVLDLDHNQTSNPEDQTYLIDGYIGTYFLFFKNNNGVEPCEKLMIGYSINGYNPGVPFGYPFSESTASGVTVGLFCSMIPAGSPQSFGSDPTTEGFLVNDATKIHGSGLVSASTNDWSVAFKNRGSTTYHAQIITDGRTVVFRINKENRMGSMWFVGPVIETLAHPTMDNAPTAKMLSKHLVYHRNSEASDDSGSGSWGYDFWESISSSYYNKYTRVDLFNAVGDHLHSSNGHGIFFTSDSQLLSSLISNSSIAGFNRWAAISCGVMSPDPTTHYIVQGDGLKGYLDTNFIRCVLDVYTVGQTFDDGNFVYIGDGIALGWDPSNGAFNG